MPQWLLLLPLKAAPELGDEMTALPGSTGQHLVQWVPPAATELPAPPAARAGSSNSPRSAMGPLSITPVRETRFLSPRKPVTKHSLVLRDQQECPSSDPKRSLVFFTLMLFKSDKSWSNAARESTGDKPPSRAMSWWGWPGAGGSSPGHQQTTPSREEGTGITWTLRFQPVFQHTNIWCVEEIKQCVPQAKFPWTTLYNPGVRNALCAFMQNTIATGLFAFVWSTKLACILSAKTKYVWVQFSFQGTFLP